jgi:predicted site-specific integrase-resolvase
MLNKVTQTDAASVSSVSQRWLNTQQAAIYLGVSVRSLEGYVRRGQLVPYKPFGRWLFDVKELDRVVVASRN